MVTCQVAHSVFSVPRKIARLRAQSYLDTMYADIYRRDHLPIDVVISPEKEVAEAALRRLSMPSAFDTESFLDDQARLLGISIADDCAVINTPLRQLSELFSTLRAVVVGIRRAGKLFVPLPDDQVYVGDQCYVFAAAEDTERTLEIFGKPMKQAERVVIVGAGNVGLDIAKQLESGQRRIRCKIIERDRGRAEAAADALERTIVLNGDGLDVAIMEEANMATADAMLAVTDDDKVNLLACARAKANGCPLVIALINDPAMTSLMAPLGIDAFINPRATTVSSILRHIRHGRVRAVYSIGDAEAEVIEAQVMGASSITGQYIRDISWPEGSIVGAIRKGKLVQLPRGDTRIDEGDILTIFAMSADVPKVEQLLQVSMDFF